ncbi:PspA/IM30 family protein [Paenibacillus sp. TRM 82003]|nr:PspA/IM30 family protein [Paenibacillus sp. TRM 82003]
MGIFKRLRDISLASIHEILNRAEDPIPLMNQYIRDMETELSEAEVAFAKQIAAEKRALHQLEEAEEMAAKREAGAIQALQAGDESLARRAIADKKTHVGKAETFRATHEAAKRLSGELRGQLQEMRAELEQMKRSRDELTARAEAAKAQKKMNETMSGFGKGGAANEFQRMKERIVQLEAEAEASGELQKEGKNLDRELRALESKSDIDEELERLKRQLDN